MAKQYGVLTFDMQVCCGNVTQQTARSLVKRKVADWVKDRNAIRLRRGERHSYPIRCGISASPGPHLAERYVDTKNGAKNTDRESPVVAAVDAWAGRTRTGRNP
jgi:hypothetical protein